MTQVGTVIEVWRYPVSSVGGEMLERAAVAPSGLPGDRRFALFDAETGLAAAPEKDVRWRPALLLRSHYSGEALPSLVFPEGADLRLDDQRLAPRLRQHFGFDTQIGTYGHSEASGDLRVPLVSGRYEPACMHIVTTASLARLAQIAELEHVDRRRFRPTLLVDTGEAQGFVENDWIGGSISIAGLSVAVTDGTRRCGMTLIAQPKLADEAEIAEEPSVLRTIMRHNARNLGVYARVEHEAEIVCGDAVYAGI